MRKLEVTISGRWYLTLAIAMGVVALLSGNNVLYLIESLLLSGLILSGILSERALSAVRIEVRRRPISAASPAEDLVIVTNARKFPVFCLEIGEWKGKRLRPYAYLAKLEPRSRLVLPSWLVLPRRGRHAWEGLAVATSYPFGFARKIRVITEPGERVVWPARPGIEVADGEVRPYAPDDDSRMIVWTLSARGGEPVVRPRRAVVGSGEITLDLRQPPGEEFERLVVDAAQPFHESQDRVLVLVGANGKRKVHGQAKALTELATVEAEPPR